MTRGEESGSLRLIEIVTLLSFLPEREEVPSFPSGEIGLTGILVFGICRRYSAQPADVELGIYCRQ